MAIAISFIPVQFSVLFICMVALAKRQWGRSNLLLKTSHRATCHLSNHMYVSCPNTAKASDAKRNVNKRESNSLSPFLHKKLTEECQQLY